MDAAAIALCKEVAGAKFAFVQSDEISVLATDFEDEGSQAWFDGNIQKWVSIAAGIAGAAFNAKISEWNRGTFYTREGAILPISIKKPTAVFDARVFTIPDYIEVENYFIWRQKDAERNSVTLLAGNYASSKELHGKNISDRHEIIHAAGDNWANHPVRFKHGGVIRRMVNVDLETTPLNPFLGRKSGKTKLNEAIVESILRTSWQLDEATPVFTKDKDYLRSMIPRHWEGDETALKERV
jgi:tRNA(His) 5'-end guanylyltransferase